MRYKIQRWSENILFTLGCPQIIKNIAYLEYNIYRYLVLEREINNINIVTKWLFTDSQYSKGKPDNINNGMPCAT
jgi:hypothetical protein